MLSKKSVCRFIILAFSFTFGISNAQEADRIFNMSLEELLNIKITTAAKFEQKKWEAPSTISVITDEDIKTYGYKSIWDALKTVVGSIPSDNGNYESIGFRALLEPAKYNSRILWLVDGHTLNESYFQWFLPGIKSGIDISTIKRIEIIRGPGSVLYGSNAFIGIVNIITKDGKDINGINVSASAGGVLTSAGGFKINKPRKLFNDISGRISFGKKLSEDEMIMLSAARTENLGQLMYVPFFAATQKGELTQYIDYEKATFLMAKFTKGEFSLFGQYTNSDNGRPLADYGSDPGSLNNKTLMSRYSFEAKYDHPFDENVRFMSRIFADRTKYEGNWSYDNSANLDVQTVPSTFWGFESNVSWKLADQFVLCGLEFQQHKTSQTESYPSENNYYAYDEYKFSNIAFYVQDIINIVEGLNLNVGFRYEYNQNYHGILIGRGALVYSAAPGTILKLQYGDAFMNPLLHDYYYHSSVLNMRNYEITNLSRERQRTLEIVWDNQYNKFQSELSLFYTRYDNFINVTNLDYYANTAGIISYGLELSLNYILSNSLSGYANSTLLRAKDDETNSRVMNSPDYSIKFGIVNKNILDERLTAALEAQIYGRTDFKDTPQQPDKNFMQKAFILANMNINYDASECLGFSLGIYNLFNTAYYYAVSKGEVQPLFGNGRSFSLTANITY